MKRITSALLIIVMLCGMCTISVGAYTAYDSANDYSKYEMPRRNIMPGMALMV